MKSTVWSLTLSLIISITSWAGKDSGNGKDTKGTGCDDLMTGIGRLKELMAMATEKLRKKETDPLLARELRRYATDVYWLSQRSGLPSEVSAAINLAKLLEPVIKKAKIQTKIVR